MSTRPERPERPAVEAAPPPDRGHYAPAYAREAADRPFRPFSPPAEVAVGDQARGWPPLVCPPAPPVALWRYAAEAAWCAPYALRLRRAGMVYAALVAIPVAAGAYSVAWLAQTVGGIGGDWLPESADGRWRRWLAAHPPALADLIDQIAALPAGLRPVAAGAVAVSALAYGAVWLVARPGRVAAAALFTAAQLV